ncbi:hypothetical protein HanIR_Chr15g0745511 [Helianthus annuus]|nr:hypothetical protein HanIR_Chr15g0745511 [Helianthus annuus]
MFGLKTLATTILIVTKSNAEFWVVNLFDPFTILSNASSLFLFKSFRPYILYIYLIIYLIYASTYHAKKCW